MSGDEPYLPVEDGLFETKSIVGDQFSCTPKGFEPEQLKKCVYREDHVTAIMMKLHAMVRRENKAYPGLYLQGPAGVGKSVLVYTITQIAKFELKWLTVYLANCKEWQQNNQSTRAMAYFLDRVHGAFSVDEIQGSFPEVWKKLNGPIEKKEFESWGDIALKHGEEERVSLLFHEVMKFLREGSGDTPVLLIFDEVNALDAKRRELEPWSITDFQINPVHHGALLVSGTTDSEFVSTIPAGMDRTYECIYNVTEFEPQETENLLNTEMGLPLKKIRDFDPKLWHEIADACGNMPRELTGFAKRLRELSSAIDDDDDLNEPDRKRSKLELDICTVIDKQKRDDQMYHRRLFEVVIKRDQSRGVNVFEKNLLQWCSKFFLENELVASHEILRAPNFIVQGTQMRPTTVDAAQAYFDWFVQQSQEQEQEPSSILQNLAVLSDARSDANGSERGHAFERYLSSKLTLCGKGDFRLIYRVLRESQTHSLRMQVRNRLFTKADCPPNDFRNFPMDTLLTHTDRDGGQARVDLIHYGSTDVVYMEATVGNYRTTKLPSGEEEEARIELILGAIKKWLGKEVYDVEVNADSSGLTCTYAKSYTSRSNAERKPPPQVHYIVVTTCPLSVQPIAERAKKYRWIKVCFLDDLVAAGVIPSERSALILAAQAEDARGGGLLDWLGLKFPNPFGRARMG